MSSYGRSSGYLRLAFMPTGRSGTMGATPGGRGGRRKGTLSQRSRLRLMHAGSSSSGEPLSCARALSGQYNEGLQGCGPVPCASKAPPALVVAVLAGLKGRLPATFGKAGSKVDG